MKALFLTASLIACAIFVDGQDFHYSQYFTAPTYLNPSLAGSFKGKLRIVSNYKSQWNSVSSQPYNTMSASADGSVLKEKLGLGISVFNDVAGKSKMGLTSFALTASSKVNVTENSSLGFGIMAGFCQRKINYNNLNWQNQWDGQSFNSTLPSGETNVATNYNYLDLSAGISFHTLLLGKTKWNSGISAFHVNRPHNSFYSSNDLLSMKFVAHTDLVIPSKSENIFVLPSIVYFRQGSSEELNAGLTIKRVLGISSRYTGANVSSALLLGTYYRHKDAVIAYVGFEYKNYLSIGMSYDINLSKLSKASQARGGIEISIGYKLMSK